MLPIQHLPEATDQLVVLELGLHTKQLAVGLAVPEA